MPGAVLTQHKDTASYLARIAGNATSLKCQREKMHNGRDRLIQIISPWRTILKQGLQHALADGRAEENSQLCMQRGAESHPVTLW